MMTATFGILVIKIPKWALSFKK